MSLLVQCRGSEILMCINKLEIGWMSVIGWTSVLAIEQFTFGPLLAGGSKNTGCCVYTVFL